MSVRRAGRRAGDRPVARRAARRPGRLVSGRARRLVRRLGALAGVTLVALVVGALPASADPAGPTNYSSEVVAVTPPVDGIEVEVLGGDAFLQVRNDGHQVQVPGYDDGEQYLRFDPDGTVWVNVRAPTHWQNGARYSIQDSQVPATAGPDQPPRWEQVSDDGTYAWHDHRVHWMSPTTLPGEVDPSVSARQVAYEWPVTIVVDGEPVQVTGRLTWVPSVSPMVAIVAALATLVLGVLLLVVRGSSTTLAVLVGVGVVATGVVGVAGMVGLPPGVQGEPLPVILSGVALLVGLAGLSMRGRSAVAGLIAGAAGIPLLVWAFTQVGAVTAPIVPPSVLPETLTRAVVGIAAGAGLALVAAGLQDLFSRPLGGPAPEPADPEPTGSTP